MTIDPEIRTLGRAIQIAGLICLVTALVHAGRIVFETLADGPVGADGALGMLNAALIGLVQASPFLFLICGLAAAARLGGRYVRGEMFTAANARLIGGFGLSLALAAGAIILIRPTLLDWIGGVETGIGIRVDEAGIALAACGVFIMVMSRAMARAAALRAENDSFI